MKNITPFSLQMILRIIFLVSLLAPVIAQGNPTLLKDINTDVNNLGSDIRKLKAIGAKAFFVADDHMNGPQLWVSDGTTDGTTMPKILDPLAGAFDTADGTNMNAMINVNGILYFASSWSSTAPKLWRSDGTEAGTYRISDSVTVRYPEYMAAVGNTVFFIAESELGHELWKTDGTQAGTVLLKDICPGACNSYPANLTNVNGTLYFSAYHPAVGDELFRSDGTPEGTYLVKDINPGPQSSMTGDFLTYFRAFNGMLYFVANDGSTGGELWRSDGTAAGTIRLKDIYLGPSNSRAFLLGSSGSVLFFLADDGINGFELWKTDGTESGTVLVSNTNPGSTPILWNATNPTYLVNNGLLYYVVESGWGQEGLWRSDGTSAGTYRLMQGVGFSIAPLNNQVIFGYSNPAVGYGVWKTDGTVAGTSLIRELRPVVNGQAGVASMFVGIGSSVLFVASDGDNNEELWKTDGTAAGTVLVRDIYAPFGADSRPTDFVSLNGATYFSATGGSAFRYKHFRTDGTPSGTAALESFDFRFCCANYNRNPGSVANSNALYFGAYNDLNRSQLWVTDGTEAGTRLVKTFANDFDNLLPGSMFLSNNLLYFLKGDPTNGQQVWRSDGTDAGTFILDPIAGQLSYAVNSVEFVEHAGFVYFTTYYGRLVKTDGTQQGTQIVKTFTNGVGPPHSLTKLNGTLYLLASNGPSERGLWRSDGTAQGTVLVKDLNPTGDLPNLIEMEAVGGQLFFVTNNSTADWSLWSSDGTAQGTSLIRSFNFPIRIVGALNGLLFLRVADQSLGSASQLWRSDGTPAGTYFLKDTGTESYYLDKLIFHGGLAYFSIYSTNATSLWRTDGTVAGTSLVEYLTGTYFITAFSTPNGLLMIGRNQNVGEELWHYALTAADGAQLEVNKTGLGAGTVTSMPAGINCGADCSESLTPGTAITLTATPVSGSVFVGWSGVNCTSGNSNPTCSFTLNTNTTVTVTFAPSTPVDVAYPDFNADNKPDLIWRSDGGLAYLWYMNGTSLLSDVFIADIDPGWKIVGVADFNGDGHPDLVWRNGAGNTYVWYMNGASFISDAFLFSLPAEWVIQGVADFNKDGKPDFLMRNTVSGNAFVWFFNNANAIGDQFLFNIDPSWKVEGVADLNADGQPDLLFRNMVSGLSFAWNSQYQGGALSLTTSSPPIFSIDPAWEVVQVADWNADGKPDLVFRNKNTGVVFVWYLNGISLTTSDFIVQIDPSWEIQPNR